MRLPFFRAKDKATEPTPPKRPGRAGATNALPDDAAIAAARTQARRRLVGALLLLAVGVIGFPLLFETQPRPLPQDTPMIVVGEAPPARAPEPVRAAPLPEVPADAGVEPVASAPSPGPQTLPPAAAPPAATPPASVATPAPTLAATPGPASKPTTPTPAPPAAAPAPRPVAPAATAVPSNGRWVVQVGAYNDPERLRAARARLQLLGFQSYTQDVDTPTGRRTRVRVGPYPTRDQADAVAARLKSAGLQAAVMAP